MNRVSVGLAGKPGLPSLCNPHFLVFALRLVGDGQLDVPQVSQVVDRFVEVPAATSKAQMYGDFGAIFGLVLDEAQDFGLSFRQFLMRPFMRLVMRLADARHLRVNRQFHEKIGPPLVRGEPQRRGAILGHRFSDRRNSRTAAFRQIEFLQELPYAAAAITPCRDLVAVQGFNLNRSIRAG